MLRRAAVAAIFIVCAGAGSRQTPAPVAVVVPQPSPTPRILVRDHGAFTGAVDDIAAEALKRGPIAGMSIAVFERGLPVLAKGYGYTDVEAKTPAEPDTSYPIASIS